MSATITPRPVWERHLQREAGKEPGPPSDEERRDAIAVIKDGWMTAWAPGGFVMLAEAERMLEEHGR